MASFPELGVSPGQSKKQSKPEGCSHNTSIFIYMLFLYVNGEGAIKNVKLKRGLTCEVSAWIHHHSTFKVVDTDTYPEVEFWKARLSKFS